MKLKEVEQNHQELVQQFKDQYGNVDFVELDEQGSNLLIKCLESKLQLKELTVDEWRFNRYHKPSIERQILVVKEHIRNYKFLSKRV